EGETRPGDYKSPALSRSATPPKRKAGCWRTRRGLTFRGSRIEDERLQSVIGSVNYAAVPQRDVRAEYSSIGRRRRRGLRRLSHLFTSRSGHPPGGLRVGGFPPAPVLPAPEIRRGHKISYILSQQHQATHHILRLRPLGARDESHFAVMQL